jgi:hypothetical protein
MAAFGRRLSHELEAPLPTAMSRLTPPAAEHRPAASDELTLLRLADLAALNGRRTGLGLCLRRSLIRYHYLRRAGLPVTIHFGARFVEGKPDRQVTGHAWLTLDGRPYHEAGGNWRGFTVMISFPADLPG